MVGLSEAAVVVVAVVAVVLAVVAEVVRVVVVVVFGKDGMSSPTKAASAVGGLPSLIFPRKLNFKSCPFLSFRFQPLFTSIYLVLPSEIPSTSALQTCKSSESCQCQGKPHSKYRTDPTVHLSGSVLPVADPGGGG